MQNADASTFHQPAANALSGHVLAPPLIVQQKTLQPPLQVAADPHTDAWAAGLST
jgi:hypothetical protein